MRLSKNRRSQAKSGDSLRDYVLLAMFATIVLLLAFTPIGFIHLVVIKATIVQVPVIIGSILLGPKKGALLGFLFGFCSFVSNTATPSLLSFCFSPLIPVPGLSRGSLWAVVICFVPRILVGILPGVVYRLVRGLLRQDTRRAQTVLLCCVGAFGALVNTVLVMGLIYFVFRDAYAMAKSVPVEAVLGLILGVVGTNGLAEAAVSTPITALVCYPLQRMMGHIAPPVSPAEPAPQQDSEQQP